MTDKDGHTVDLGTDVRVAAVEALARLESPLASKGLLRALDDPDEAVRVAGVRGLCKRGGPAALEPLIGVAAHWTDSDRALSRAEAVDGLVSLGDERVASGAVAQFLARPAALDSSDCDAAARLVRSAGEAAVRSTIDDLIAHLREGSAPVCVRKLLVALAPESVEALIAALGDERARPDAALALGSTGASRAVEPLSALLLTDEAREVRRAAAWALGTIRDPAAVEPLLLATRDPEFAVRIEAIEGFEKLGNAGVALAVGALVGPAHEETARRALESIAAAADDRALAQGPAQPEGGARANGVRPAASAETPEAQPGTGRRSVPALRRALDRYLRD